MGLNEKVIKMLYYARSSKTVQKPPEGRSTERTPGWVERANKMYLVASCSPFDQAAQSSEPLLWLKEPSDIHRMLFFDSSSAWGYFIIIYS